MRALILSIGLALPSAVLAETLKPIDCGARSGCQRAFLLEGFHSLDTRPVPLSGNRVVLLGLDGLTEDASLWLLDPSVTDGSVNGAVHVEIDGSELDMVRAMVRDDHPVKAEISPGGAMFALIVLRTQGYRLRFFGASGKPMGEVARPFLEPWPSAQDFEFTPVDLFARFVGMNALKFDETGLRLGYAGLSIMADYETGEVSIVDTTSDDRDDLVDRLEPAFDPVGYESYWFGEGRAAATNYPGDGTPAQLAVLQGGRAFAPYAMPPLSERGDRMIDANAASDLGLIFAEPILSADGARLAVLRKDDTGAALAIYDTATGTMTWSSGLPSGQQDLSTLVWSDDGSLVHVAQGENGVELYVYRSSP